MLLYVIKQQCNYCCNYVKLNMKTMYLTNSMEIGQHEEAFLLTLYYILLSWCFLRACLGVRQISVSYCSYQH